MRVRNKTYGQTHVQGDYFLLRPCRFGVCNAVPAIIMGKIVTVFIFLSVVATFTALVVGVTAGEKGEKKTMFRAGNIIVFSGIVIGICVCLVVFRIFLPVAGDLLLG